MTIVVVLKNSVVLMLKSERQSKIQFAKVIKPPFTPILSRILKAFALITLIPWCQDHPHPTYPPPFFFYETQFFYQALLFW